MKAILVALALMTGVVASAYAQGCGYGTAPPRQEPEAFLHAIFDRYIGPPETTRPIDYSKEAQLRRYFVPEVVAMIMKDRAAADAANEVPMLDGDPFVGSQEWNIASFDIRIERQDANTALATVKFTNYAQARIERIRMAYVGGQWRIADIDYGGDAGTLRGIFKQNR